MNASNHIVSTRPRRLGHLACLLLSASLLLAAALAPAAQAEGIGFLPGPAGFDGMIENADGSPDLQAGSHPYQVTTGFSLQTTPDTNGHLITNGGNLKDFTVDVPPGLIGDPNAVPICSEAEFLSGPRCTNETSVGVLHVELGNGAIRHISASVYNLQPSAGVPAVFGAWVGGGAFFISSLRSDSDYGISISVLDATQTIAPIGGTLTLWGIPADPRHNSLRGEDCLHGFTVSCPSSATPKPLITLPTSCTGPLPFTIAADSWAAPGLFATDSFLTHDGSANPVGIEGCDRLSLSPSVSARPTTVLASAPTGLDFHIDIADEGLTSPQGLAQSQVKKTVVTLPQGFTINPSAAEGLGACTPSDFHRESAASPPGAGCPNSSKVGEVTIETPLLRQPVTGSLFVAQPDDPATTTPGAENPFDSLLALYFVAKLPERGVLVKAAGKVEPDPETGQLTTTFDNLPQLPFAHFTLHFREGARAPLVSPPTCGTYTAQAEFVPWSAPEEVIHASSAFTITKGFDGGACPAGGTPPFHPELLAGTINNAAGSYSPFYVRISRNDGEQEITHFSIKLPPGVSGKLAGIPECSDAAIAAAKGREHEGGGVEEQQSPSCPLASEVGHTIVETGVGSVLAKVPGRVYLAGPYHGSNLSVVAITAAKVGPFDLGTVVVRQALKINPETAEVFIDATGSDPIPHIVDGIPTHLRTIRVYVDRPEFVLNPTGCEPTSTASTVLGSGTNFVSEADDQPVTVSSPFQAADCASLGFKPELALSLIGGTKRGQDPKLKAVLTARPGDANIGRAQVTLPHSEFLDNAHIKTICTRVQFKEGTTPGEKCPAASVYGFAKATTPILSEPLEGPVYLRSSSHQLPDLVAALHNKQVDIALDGHVEGVHGGIRNTFEAVPDAPVTKFTLEMQGAGKGLLKNSTNLCAKPHHATADFVGHNGKVENFKPLLQVQCGKHGKKGKAGKRHHRGARR